MDKKYLAYCESLWSKWLGGSLNLPDDLAARLQTEFAPEPYLRFGSGKKPLYVLLTNPGKGKSHQRLTVVKNGKSCISPEMTYFDASLALGNFYAKHLIAGKAARVRLEGMVRFQRLAGADCLVQFESIPFHSASLPAKRKFLGLVANNKTLREYQEVLTAALQKHSVVAVSAVRSGPSISKASVESSDWLSWQASLLGITPRRLRIEELVNKNGKVTQAFLYDRIADATRGFILTMGNARWPSSKVEPLIAKCLTSR